MEPVYFFQKFPNISLQIYSLGLRFGCELYVLGLGLGYVSAVLRWFDVEPRRGVRPHVQIQNVEVGDR